MATQIVHEAEVHRQHVRLKIPITIEIDSNRFTVDDWSMGGFGIQADITSRQPGERFPARMIFPFEDFELSLRLDCQMVYLSEDRSRFGCRFVGMSAGQIGLFRYLIDAYLSGELVSAGDVLALAARTQGAEARGQPLRFSPFAEEQSFGHRLRRAVGVLFFLALGGALAAMIAFGVNERFLTVRADSAVIDAPDYVVRAPLSGIVTGLAGAAIVEPGIPLARISGADGQAADLTSPCVCVVQRWLIPDGQYVQIGEPVAQLVAADQPLTVRARVPFAKARRLEVGGLAEISIPGKEAPVSGEIDRLDFRTSAADGEIGRHATVVVRPDTPLDFEDLGSLVEVRFR